MAKSKKTKPVSKHNHVEGEKCYECGFGVKKVSWKCIVGATVIGLAFGMYLAAGGALSQDQILSYLTIILGVVTLAVLVDTRKMILNCLFEKK